MSSMVAAPTEASPGADVEWQTVPWTAQSWLSTARACSLAVDTRQSSCWLQGELEGAQTAPFSQPETPLCALHRWNQCKSVAGVAPTQAGFRSYHAPLQRHKGDTCHADTPLGFLGANNNFLRQHRRPTDSCKHPGITGTDIPVRKYVERGHNHIHAALSICRSALQQPPARRADLLRMLVALTHLRQLPSLQLQGELAARAGAESLLQWPRLCCRARFFQQPHGLLCHIMSGWSPVLLYKRLLYACSSLPLFIPPSA